MLLSADLAGRTGTTFCRAKRSSSAAAPVGEFALAPCEARRGLPVSRVTAAAGVCSEVRERNGVTISKPGSLGRMEAASG